MCWYCCWSRGRLRFAYCPVARNDDMGVPHRLANGITINEPEPLHVRASYRFREASLEASVSGKGKRKMDAILTDPSTAAYVMSDSPSTSFAADAAGSHVCAGNLDSCEFSTSGSSTSRAHVSTATYS